MFFMRTWMCIDVSMCGYWYWLFLTSGRSEARLLSAFPTRSCRWVQCTGFMWARPLIIEHVPIIDELHLINWNIFHLHFSLQSIHPRMWLVRFVVSWLRSCVPLVTFATYEPRFSWYTWLVPSERPHQCRHCVFVRGTLMWRAPSNCFNTYWLSNTCSFCRDAR